MLKNILIGWIPQWVWDIFSLLPYVGVAALVVIAISLAYRAYQLGGWPALSALGAIYGFITGYVLAKRRHTVVEEEVVPKRRVPIPTHRPKGTTVWDEWEKRIGANQ